MPKLGENWFQGTACCTLKELDRKLLPLIVGYSTKQFTSNHRRTFTNRH